MSAKRRREPQALLVDDHGLPHNLTTGEVFLCWRWKWIEGADGKPGKWTKPPVSAKPGAKDDATDRASGVSIEDALVFMVKNKLPGIGRMLFLEDNIVGFDLDDSVDPMTGEITDPEAREIIRDLDSYTEYSPSRTGVRIFTYGKLPPGRRRIGHVEMYDSGRYLTLTGAHLPTTPQTIEHRQPQIDALHRRLFPDPVRPAPSPQITTPINRDTEAILDQVLKTAKGYKLHLGDFSAYPSQSEADQALANLYVAAGASRSQADDLFRRSALFRGKWDKRHHGDGRTYGEGTLDRAFDGTVPLWNTVTASPPAPPCQDDQPLDVPDDTPCDVRLAAALRELAIERSLRVAAEAARDHLQSQVDNLNDRWHWEQKVRETPTVQPEADLINACGWIYEATVNQPETYERPDGKRVFRKTKDGFVRTTRAELAQRTGKSERTITTKLAVAKKLGVIDVRHEPERIIDSETGEIQIVPDSTVIYFRPREGQVREMHHRATSVTPADRLLATGKKHLHGGDRPACPSCGCDRRKIVCADCGYVFAEDTVLDSDVALSPTDTPLEKVAGNSKGAPRTVGRLRGVDKMTRGVRGNDAPSWLDDAPDLEDPIYGWMPGFEPTLDRWTDVQIGGRA